MDEFVQGLTFLKSEENMVNEIPAKAIEVKSEENMVDKIPTKAISVKSEKNLVNEIPKKGFWEAEEKFWAAHETSRGIPMVLLLKRLKNDKGKTFLSIANGRTLIESKAVGRVSGVAAAWHWAFKMQLKEFSLKERSFWCTYNRLRAATKVIELEMTLKPAGQFEKMSIEDLHLSCLALHRQQVPTAPATDQVFKTCTKTYHKEAEASHKVEFLDDSKKLDLKNWILKKIIHYSQVSSYHHRRLRMFLAVAEAIEMQVPSHVPTIIQKGIIKNGRFPKKQGY